MVVQGEPSHCCDATSAVSSPPPGACFGVIALPVDAAGRPHTPPALITAAVRALGVVSGDVLLVHSSLSSLGHVPGGAPAVVEALLAAVSPGGTVLFPTFTGSAALGPDNPPHFRPGQDPCWTGAIPEASRRHPEAIRSFGPTHSVCAIGARAAEFTAGHESSPTPCGPGSPFDKLRRCGGKVLFVGVGLECNTLFHHVEEAAGAPYVCQPEPVAATVELPGGRVLQTPLRIHLYGPPRDYPLFEDDLIERGILALGQAGPAPLRLLQAGPFCDLMIPRVQADPTILLSTRPT
jgi:aminoglycoside 3-N-acetyltransferase